MEEKHGSVFPKRLSPRASWVIAGFVVLLACAGLWGYWRNSARIGAAGSAPARDTASDIVHVQVASPERNEIFRQVSLPASLEAFEQTTLYAKVSGYLKWIKVDIGDRVRKGQILAEIDVPELAAEYAGSEAEVERAQANIGNTKADLQRAKAELELKKITYERLKSIRDQEPDVMPQQQVDEAKAEYDVAGAVLKVGESRIRVAQSELSKAEASKARFSSLREYTTIRAPFDGVVIKRHVDPGALIQQSQSNVSPVVTVARVDMLRVFIDVNEPEVPFIKKGNTVTVVVDALPGRVFEGTCTRFTTALDPKTRTMRTEIDILNHDGELRPGMFGLVKLALERRANALTVPATALKAEGGRSYVYLAADGKASRTEVKTGFDDGIRVEITEGLRGEEQLIVSGTSGIRDGLAVKVSQK
ncbi:MAG: efflux RND transporter periplasmic adaptor subunit [Acidobacteria bacterium]|nr:efflux RND transporter periplasmic adaptor subunit [Acidobacteriota bacterium]